ncbi:restriction endonuclease subunit S [Streptomyces sp. PT12]|uniref:restriction endonuclease subunit S n=1 Tax=Streptomyces sp. PT12 TaxID=1510197 RepID=UPI0011BE7149|nr:restriction endonuclease subunit S [Streptomyces sp. PT12]
MSKLNAWEGALAVVPIPFDGTHVSPEYPVFDINSELADPAYVRHLVAWPPLWELLTPRGSMVRRKRTTPETLLNTPVPLPELSEQRRIADRLDATLGRADAVLDLRKRMTTLQGNLAASLIASAVESATESVRMGDVIALERTALDIDPDSEYRVIGMRSFGKGVIRYPASLGSEVSRMNYFTFPAEALILSNIKAWEGAIGITSREESRDYVASNRFLTYVPVDDRVNIGYLRHYLLSREGLAKVSAASPGGADRNRTLGRKRFEALTFRLPPRSVQDRIARTLDALAERLDSAYSEPALDALRPSLLNAAFTGQL